MKPSNLENDTPFARQCHDKNRVSVFTWPAIFRPNGGSADVVGLFLTMFLVRTEKGPVPRPVPAFDCPKRAEGRKGPKRYAELGGGAA
ncbi:hypothetical protein [Rhodovastum atsumiense]|uniref:Uncharacterized protein n=1 Tax=Rhodovastum atsumiense TaxID=504468 RepID=A0A5M6IPU4_9PROT|nr:hypothetical protein [Rhodovastum atsumiense]KAA5609578.1 hypothetical protein F1189_23425 [Rhodovastum atsumiense]